ncbi:MAG TPA: hypothetical protein VG940_08715 [Gemmatimonadales bacterium]|nr:hypothetical protein [Gemmatimonadales bacterium]
MSPAKAADLRVRVSDAWVDVDLPWSPDLRIGELKLRALVATQRAGDPAGYEVKFRGASVDDSATVGTLKVPAGAGLIVLPRRRQAVR